MTLHGFMPGAIAKNIPPGSSDPAIIPAGVLQHIAVSNSPSLFGLFSNDGGIESHFYIRKDGTIEQYRSIFFEADAQFAGNSFGSPRKGFISVEHEGGVGADLNVPMPQAQLDSFHRVVLWVKSQADFPLRVCPAWDAPGVGYHALFDQWNTNHHSCPGPARIKQFHDVTVPWLREASQPVPTGPKRLSAADIFHVHGTHPYYEEDSLRGLKLALAKLFGIDFDIQKTKDDVLIVAHGPRPLAKNRKGGFIDPQAKTATDTVKASDTYADLTWAQVERLRSADGKDYRISRADVLIPKAVKQGAKVVEPEAKTSHITKADWSALRAKISNPSKVRVKAFPRFLPSLEHAHEAKFPTIALTHKGQNTLPKSAAKWLDYFRGRKPRWK